MLPHETTNYKKLIFSNLDYSKLLSYCDISISPSFNKKDYRSFNHKIPFYDYEHLFKLLFHSYISKHDRNLIKEIRIYELRSHNANTVHQYLCYKTLNFNDIQEKINEFFQ